MSEEVDGFLAHYGVMGMKWGKRKSRDESGKPVNDSEKSAHRVKLEAKYLKKGFSTSEAETKANGRIRTEKILLAAGGVAVVGLAAYSGKRHFDKQFTGVDLDLGAKLYNINALGDKQDLNRRMYTTFEAGDTKKYKGLLAAQLRKNKADTTVYEATLKATERIKAPSQKEAAKLYKEFATTYGMGNTAIPYLKFNQFLVEASPQNENFYDFMKSKGYNAILDANDQFLSGYNTKKPLIVFNAASSTVKAGQAIVDEQLTNKLAGRQTAAIIAKQMAPTIGLGVAIVGRSNAKSTKNKYGTVNKYFAENPDSKLSYAEVYSKLKEKKPGEYSYDG